MKEGFNVRPCASPLSFVYRSLGCTSNVHIICGKPHNFPGRIFPRRFLLTNTSKSQARPLPSAIGTSLNHRGQRGLKRRHEAREEMYTSSRRREMAGQEGRRSQRAVPSGRRRALPLLFTLAFTLHMVARGGSAVEDAHGAAGGGSVGGAGRGADAAAAGTLATATMAGGGAVVGGTAGADDSARYDGGEMRAASAPREGVPSQVSGGLRGTGGREGQMRRTNREMQGRRLSDITVGTLGRDFDVADKGPGAVSQEQNLTEGTLATPPVWDSSLCMAHWGLPHLQSKPDPNGYLVYVNGREQLGGNKYLMTDGIFVAKALNRTFVEYPVKDSRVVSIEEESIGLGAYWDLTEMCMYHRILDLGSFRDMMADGSIPPNAFTTITSAGSEVELRRVHTEHEAREHFQKYSGVQVLALEGTWKSNVVRASLQYLRPNPFYLGVVRMLLEQQKEWATGQFLAVQWRTETSFGNLTECYQEVKAVVEEQREKLGYGTHQVLFNTDLYGKTSGTFSASAQAKGNSVLELINEDYPQALHNELHHFFTEIDDAGVRAFVSGLAVASSEVMIGSSLNPPSTKDIREANRCQKPYSGYIMLIAGWRADILQKPGDSIIRMFPFE
ncbi:unnamed protein product [Pylaiella littoralis]